MRMPHLKGEEDRIKEKERHEHAQKERDQKEK